VHVLAPDSAEHLMLAPESVHTPGCHCRAQPLIGGLLISCMMYFRTYGCRRVLGSLYPCPSTRKTHIWHTSAQTFSSSEQVTQQLPFNTNIISLINNYDLKACTCLLVFKSG